MNRLLFTVLVSWQTKNRRRQHKAENWCKDFGLLPLQKTLYIGSLYRSEQIKLNKKLRALFIGKRELYHSFPICSSCIKDATVYPKLLDTVLKKPSYEIVRVKNSC